MRPLTLAVAMLTLAGCAENSAIARAIRGGPPQSEAVALAAEQFSCDPATLRTEQLGHDVRIRGCGQTAVYGRARDGWVVGLRHRDAGWIVGKDYHPEDLEVFSRAVDDLDCAPYEVVLERRNGIRIAKGCGAALASGSKGLMIVRCLLGTDGRVSACDVIKGLDVHNAVVLDALYSHRYTPVTLDGRPIAVDYVFNILIR